MRKRDIGRRNACGKAQRINSGVVAIIVDHVVAVATRKEIDVRPLSACKLVAAYAAAQRVVSILPEEAIISCITLERVVAFAAVEEIAAAASDKLVVSILTVEHVVARITCQRIVTRSTEENLLIGQAGLEELLL